MHCNGFPRGRPSPCASPVAHSVVFAPLSAFGPAVYTRVPETLWLLTIRRPLPRFALRMAVFSVVRAPLPELVQRPVLLK